MRMKEETSTNDSLRIRGSGKKEQDILKKALVLLKKGGYLFKKLLIFF